ncbi:hypothetical protein K1719_028861 [Acacia pycnantha]|nr:hypothetical protein K1719_028861 [Acacia pycnantha]
MTLGDPVAFLLAFVAPDLETCTGLRGGGLDGGAARRQNHKRANNPKAERVVKGTRDLRIRNIEVKFENALLTGEFGQVLKLAVLMGVDMYESRF